MTACTSPPATSSSPSIKSVRWATCPHSHMQSPPAADQRRMAHRTTCLPMHRLRHLYQSGRASAPVDIGPGHAEISACIVQAVKAAEDAAVHATQAAQQAEAGGSPVDVVAKATLATVRCSQVRTTQPDFLQNSSGAA